MNKPSLRQSSKANSARRAELTVETVSLAKLKPHPENPRKHPDPGTPEWEALRKSLEHDYFDPIVWNKRNGLLVSGHLRVKVLTASGFDRADCVVVDYDDAMHKVRMIAANRLVGQDDAALLKDLLQELDTGAADMDLTGYTREAIENLMTQFHVPDFQPATEGEQGRLDQKAPVTCPHCGKDFIPK